MSSCANGGRRCRVCGASLFADPLLRMDNMPKSAQSLPIYAELPDDEGITLALFQCQGCGVVQLNIPPVPYYREVIRAAAFSAEMKSFRQEQFSAFLQDYDLVGSKVFEAGCGGGEYLELMCEAGSEVVGVEASVDLAARCRHSGLNVITGFIDDEAYVLDGGPYDAFFMLNYLEHLPEPVTTLRGIWSNLRDGGVGLVEVPNFDMVLRENLFTEIVADHLCYFTKDTLTTLLNLSGFEVIDAQVVWYGYILSVVVRKRALANVRGFHVAQQRLFEDVERFIRTTDSGRVAIWGAGHQALAIMALLNLSGEIAYIVDSATFKQGRYSPATHIPIVSPDSLISDPVDAVIVMAASYSDEVVQILRTNFGASKRLAVVRGYTLEII